MRILKKKKNPLSLRCSQRITVEQREFCGQTRLRTPRKQNTGQGLDPLSPSFLTHNTGLADVTMQSAVKINDVIHVAPQEIELPLFL